MQTGSEALAEEISVEQLKADLNRQIEALYNERSEKAKIQGELDAKKFLFDTENKNLIDDLSLLREAEITLTDKIRYLALKVHSLNGEKKLADGNVTIKNYKEVDLTYDPVKVLQWAEANAPTLIKKVLDEPVFRAMLEQKGVVTDYNGKEIAKATERIEPRAQISKTLSGMEKA